MNRIVFGLALITAATCFAAITPSEKDAEYSVSGKETYAIDMRIWPKCALRNMKDWKWDEKFPVYFRLATTKDYSEIDNISYFANAVAYVCEFDEKIELLGDAVKVGCPVEIGEICNWISKRGFIEVKKYLRKQGKSFVVRDNVNPCAEAMTELNNALNAPKFAGLVEWCEKYTGKKVVLDLSGMPSDDDVKAKMKKVYDGEEELTEKWRQIILHSIGTEAFNKFVKEYNGEN